MFDIGPSEGSDVIEDDGVLVDIVNRNMSFVQVVNASTMQRMAKAEQPELHMQAKFLVHSDHSFWFSRSNSSKIIV